MTVSEAAEKYRFLRNTGAYIGPWKNETVEYLREPQDILTDSNFSGMILVGPSQCGKTDIFLNLLTHMALCDPIDVLLIHMSQHEANTFSKTRIDKMHRDSSVVGGRLMPGSTSDNVFFKRYINGSQVVIGFPTISQLSGKPVPRVFFTDYDRMPQDIDGEGSPFSLGEARTTTFGRSAKTMAESSPGFIVVDPEWAQESSHQAPPTEGILSLYNRGDRRRWYWACINCGKAFEPDFSLMRWPESNDFIEAGELARLECPYCQARYAEHADTLPGRKEMNQDGHWLREGQTFDEEGRIVGIPRRARIASFWIKGPAATFGSWADKVTKHLEALRKYEETGLETDLQANLNTVWGLPYTPKALEQQRLPEAMMDRGINYGKQVIPPPVRFLVAAVDVQKNHFAVQVHGYSSGGDIWIIDRFDIEISKRPDERRPGQNFLVSPFDEPRDWHLILEEVLCKTYPVNDGSGRRMAIKGVVCDSAGGRGTTANAYAFYRWLKNGPQAAEEAADENGVDYSTWASDLHLRFLLYKGIGKRPGFRVRVAYPDAGNRLAGRAGALGQIPVLETATNEVKDQMDAILNRTDAGSGCVRFASWLDLSWYRELCVEKLNHKNEWEKQLGKRNESWDLLIMSWAFCLVPGQVNIETIDWAKPPRWAAPWNDNDFVYDPAQVPSPTEAMEKEKLDLAELARRLA